MSLISDTGEASTLIKYLADSIPLGPHPEPHAEWISVRLDVVQTSIDHIEWLEKGNEEWRDMYVSSNQQRNAAQATARIAIEHLQALMKQIAPVGDSRVERAARDWLVSIGGSLP